MENPFAFMLIPIAVFFLIAIAAVLWPKYTNLRRPRETLTCLCKGHVWHEGEDTLITIYGHRNGPFHHGGFTWLCLRCLATTSVGEPPPKNKFWDYRWIDPTNKSGRESDCADIFRRERWETEERLRKIRNQGWSNPEAEARVDQILEDRLKNSKYIPLKRKVPPP